ncbi:GNAT family N-acetyltransferase [Streptosporangium sp. CA-115845]|uniref:GNAT family N-acetyltransferase n=1 Tax=Streptosporangium sp. CA-115845 TaxID=3240071 RepID=UPI003D923B29
MSTIVVRICLARPGDGLGVEALAGVALGIDVGMQGAAGPVATAIDQYGGRLAVPYGWAQALVACLTEAPQGADGPPPAGLAYTCPPVRLIEAYTELGSGAQQRLAQALAELELLAVAEHARGSGIGTALLSAAEDLLRRDGRHLVFAKIRLDNQKAQLWFRRRGYLLTAPGESVIFNIGEATISFDDGGDGYRLAVKSLDASRHVHRVRARTSSYLTVR